MVRALEAASVSPLFYAVDRNLRADIDDIESRLRGRAVRGGLLIHYFGWPQPPDVMRWFAARDASTGFWVEDLSQGVPAAAPPDCGATPTGMGTTGDAVLVSYRKIVPCPDGAVLAFRTLPSPLPEPVWTGSYAAHAVLRLLTMQPGVDRLGMPIDQAHIGLQHRRATKLRIGPMSAASRHIIERFDAGTAAASRRRNAIRLAARLRTIRGVSPLFVDPPDGCGPIGLPVRVSDLRTVQARLKRQGVEAAHLWSSPPGVGAGQYPAADDLAAHLLTLPIQHSYSVADIDTIAEAVAVALEPFAAVRAVAGVRAARSQRSSSWDVKWNDGP